MANFGTLAPGSDWQDQEAQANLLAAYPELRGAKPPPPSPVLPQDLPDVGPPPLSPGPQVSAGQPFANRWGNILGQAGGHLAQNVALGLPRTLWDFVKANVDASKAAAGTPEAHKGYGQLGAPTAGLAMAMMAPEAPEAGDAIERTHRLTGMPREEIVRRGIVRGEIPIYGGIPVGRPGAALGASTAFGTLAPTRQQPPASANDQLPPGARMLGPARPGVGIPYDQMDPGMPVTTLGIRG